MKNICLPIVLSLLICGCNINPSKEARVQKLETELQQSIDKINQLESKLKILEDNYEQFKSKVAELEKQ